MFTHADMMDSLSVEKLDELLYRGHPLQMGLPRIYGGQILGQALAAANLTVDPERRPHSLHGYFLRPGDTALPVIFDVDPIRDGRSFTTRRVVAKQKGRAIFNASVSFQKLEDGVEHQIDRPALPGGGEVPDPDELPPEHIEDRAMLEARGVDPALIERILLTFPPDVVDIRTPHAGKRLVPGHYAPEYGYWLRFRGEVGDDPVLHRALLAFISDRALMSTAMLPHGANFFSHEVMGASLDHAMWFHADIRVDQWLYYHVDSPRAARARGLNRGSFYTRDGVLIASTVQEGLMRIGKPRELG